MKSFATPILLALGLAATTLAQAVSVGIAPTGTAPSGCKPTFTGNFTLGTLQMSSKVRRADAVVVTLSGGVLTDSLGRTGSIVANHQFQFDGPPQAGSIYTGGWTVCANDSLALGSSTIFYRCLSGNFYNLYDISVGDQCSEINIVITPTETQSSSSSSSIATSTRSASSSGSMKSSVSGSMSVSSLSLGGGSNGTIVAGSTSISGSVRTTFPTVTATAATRSGSGTASSTGGALPTRVPKGETFGAVVGILGAAFFL